ncbi:MAG: hypothetical protein QOI63_1562 [Thermoplasmata archaeon]|nr:hypothetical protein [Thermoplasmata archaeon]
MRILVLGATGPLGQRVLQEAQRRRVAVRALVRDRARLPQASVQAVAGDATDRDALLAALTDVDAVVSALGPGTSWKARRTGTVMADSMRALLPAMQEAGVRRFVGISALGVGPTWRDLPWLLRPAYRLLLRQPLRDKEQAEALLVKSPLEWTLVCPPVLTDAEGTGGYRAAPRLKLHGIPRVARADVARLMLDCVEQDLHGCERVEVAAAADPQP